MVGNSVCNCVTEATEFAPRGSAATAGYNQGSFIPVLHYAESWCGSARNRTMSITSSRFRAASDKTGAGAAIFGNSRLKQDACMHRSGAGRLEGSRLQGYRAQGRSSSVATTFTFSITRSVLKGVLNKYKYNKHDFCMISTIMGTNDVWCFALPTCGVVRSFAKKVSQFPRSFSKFSSPSIPCSPVGMVHVNGVMYSVLLVRNFPLSATTSGAECSYSLLFPFRQNYW